MTTSATNTATPRALQWRERLARQAASGMSVAAFCKSEGIGAHTFYWWRSRLGKLDTRPALHAEGVAPFIDLGAMGEAAQSMAGVDIRLDLGHGIMLTIARR